MHGVCVLPLCALCLQSENQPSRERFLTHRSSSEGCRGGAQSATAQPRGTEEEDPLASSMI